MADPKDRPERQKSPFHSRQRPRPALPGERCRSRSISIGGAAPASGRGDKHSDRFHRRCGLPLPATFGSEVQTPGARHKPSANLFEPLSLGREVVESVARDHQCRTTLNSTYLQHLEDERLALI
jgi:hypothetical protein